MTIKRRHDCPDCGGRMELCGYQGASPEFVGEIYACPSCDSGIIHPARELEAEEETRDIDRQLSGRWEK